MKFLLTIRFSATNRGCIIFFLVVYECSSSFKQNSRKIYSQNGRHIGKMADENGFTPIYLAIRKSHVKNSNTKISLRLFLHNKASVHFPRKRITFDAILENG